MRRARKQFPSSDELGAVHAVERFGEDAARAALAGKWREQRKAGGARGVPARVGGVLADDEREQVADNRRRKLFSVKAAEVRRKARWMDSC